MDKILSARVKKMKNKVMEDMQDWMRLKRVIYGCIK